MPRADLSAVDWDRCFSCQRNKHGACEHHINDGAFDADDFINVRCKCPCQGEVREGSKLIDLVAGLRKEIRDAQDEILRVRAEDVRARQTLNRMREHLTKLFDDEGELDQRALDYMLMDVNDG